MNVTDRETGREISRVREEERARVRDGRRYRGWLREEKIDR